MRKSELRKSELQSVGQRAWSDGVVEWWSDGVLDYCVWWNEICYYKYQK